MASTRTTTRTVRIKNETAEYFSNMPMNRAVDSLCDLLTSGKMTFDGENLHVVGVHTGVSHAMSEIDSMAKCMHIETDDLLNGIYEGLNDGKLSYEKGKVVGYPDFDIEPFKEACHDAGIDPQSAMDKVIGAIRKGKI